MNMSKIIGAIITTTVSITLIGTLLATQVAEFTGTTGSLKEYSGILGAVITISIVASMMVAVKLISSGKD